MKGPLNCQQGIRIQMPTVDLHSLLQKCVHLLGFMFKEDPDRAADARQIEVRLGYTGVKLSEPKAPVW